MRGNAERSTRRGRSQWVAADEPNNLTIRQQPRRFTRQTLGFSKALVHLRAAVSIHVAWYNLRWRHGTVRIAPAMDLGIADTFRLFDL